MTAKLSKLRTSLDLSGITKLVFQDLNPLSLP